MYAILPAIGMLIAKIIGCKVENRGIYVFMTIFTNVGFMGFPVIESIIGSEALFYTAIFNMIFNIMLFTVGVKAINYPDKSGHKTDIMKILLHTRTIPRRKLKLFPCPIRTLKMEKRWLCKEAADFVR